MHATTIEYEICCLSVYAALSATFERHKLPPFCCVYFRTQFEIINVAALYPISEFVIIEAAKIYEAVDNGTRCCLISMKGTQLLAL